MADTTQRRLFVGGLFPEVTDSDLKDRFQRFGTVTSVEVKRKRNHEGAAAKTFAYLDLDVTETNYKKCLGTYNNTKWKGGIVSIQPAKQSFLTRLREERKTNQEAQEATPKKESTSDDVPIHPRVEERSEHFKKAGVKDYHVEKAVPGTTIEGEKNWIVGKYGRVMPIVYIRRPDKKKIMKVDPAKFVHHLKVIKDADSDRADSVNKSVTKLTWNVPEQKSSNYRKRKGDFPQNTKKRTEASKILKTSAKEKDLVTKSNQNKMDIMKSRKENGRSANGTKQDDFEVVVEHLGNQNANRTAVIGDDSDNDSCGSADTDEICFARKPVMTEKRTEKSVVYTPQISSYGSVPKLTHVGGQNEPRTSINSTEKLRTASNTKTKPVTSSEESSSDESDASSSIENNSDGSETNQKTRPRLHLSQTVPSKITDKGATSLDESDDVSSSESSVEDTDNDDDNDDESDSGDEIEDTYKTRNLQTKCSPKETHASTSAENDLESSTGETSSDESSVESSAIKAEDETKNKIAPKQVLQAKPNPKQTLAPKITSKALASFMGETSSDESDEEDIATDKIISGQTLDPSSNVKQTYAPKISGEDLKSFMQDSSDEDSSSESSDDDSSETTSDSDDEPGESKSLLNSDKFNKEGVSSVSKRQAIDTNDVKQNCAVINAILSDNSTLSKNQQIDSKNSPKLSSDKRKEDTQSRTASKTDSDHRTKTIGKSEVLNVKNVISDTSKPSSGKTNMSKVVVEDPKKKALGNEVRLDSLKRKHSVMTKQQAMIHDALAAVDAKDAAIPGKHFRFDSDSEEEVEQRNLKDKKGDDTKSTIQLFGSDDEMDDDAKDADDGIQFEKPQYEGKHGAKLMKMQSRFGGDSRFKMDEKFMENDAESDSEQSGEEEEMDPEEVDLREERKKSLAILEKIVGTQAMAKQKKLTDGRNTFKDLNALHYDPSKEEHSKFERNSDDDEQEENENDDGAPKVQREELPPPEVSKEKFFEVSTSLKDVFSSGTKTNQDADDDKTPFSFFAQDESEDEEEKADVDKTDEPDEAAPISSIDLMWTTKKFAYDSSDSEKEEKAPKSAASNKKRTVPDVKKTSDTKTDHHPPPMKFFFQPDDIRLQEGPLWFFNIPKADYHQDEMEERKEELKAGFRKRHKRAVRTWNRKKMERQERKQKR